MKKLFTMIMLALFVAGSSALACGGCGCQAKKSDAKKECSGSKETKEKGSCSQSGCSASKKSA
ncbi:MAG: hypothetical protein CBE26_03290 [Kiritimatiellaceae bacterium TMED266]|nr:MAG: hypothetical protein CBE26_03290 [Kiritimatiellaceae bacterium TMED266]